MKTRLNLLKRLAGDQRGVVAITFAITFGTTLVGTLFAVDMVRYNATQNRLQNSLDAAVISAGRKLADYKPSQGGEPSQSWKDDAYAFFRANMPDSYLGSDIPVDSLNINYGEERVGDSGQYLASQQISMTVTGEMPLLSAGYLSVTSMGLEASNAAVRRVRNDLELVLALDNTGSMDYDSGSKKNGEKTRMDILKTSATGLIDTVMEAAKAGGQSDGVSGAYIGLVPFTDSVNVKNIANAKSWLTSPAELQNAIDHVWTGCIVEPRPASSSGWTKNNRLPAAVLSPSASFMPMINTYSFYYTPQKLNSKIDSNNSKNYLVRWSLVTQGAGDFAFLAPSGRSVTDRRILASPESALNWYQAGKTGQTLSNLPRRFQVNLAMESQYCTKSAAMFLNQDQTALKSSVDAMTAYGGTGVPAGLLWAWRMLSPAWQGAWDGSELPRQPSPKLRKVIVLLSDGDNAPVVRRNSVQNTDKNQVFKLSYAYATCSKNSSNGETCSTWQSSLTEAKDEAVTNGSTRVNENNQNYTMALPSFTQCPVDGLLMVNPAAMTPGNYNSACATSGANSSVIGHASGNNNGQLGADADNAYMQALCTQVKADAANIQIYTLTLGNDVEAGSKAVMRGCATDADHYFDVGNAADLPDVFAQIAGALTELRLTQ